MAPSVLGMRDRHNAVRQFVRERFGERGWLQDEITEALASVHRVEPSFAGSSATVGKAIELRIALDFIDRCATPQILRALAAEHVDRIVGLARYSIDNTFSDGAADDELLQECLWLALWWEVHHAMERQGVLLRRGNGMVDAVLAERALDSSHPNQDDLRALWSKYCDGPRLRLRALGAHASLSPWLLWGWAQADLVVGRTLIEIKAAAASRVSIDAWVDQIVRYVLVAERDRFAFDSVVLYLAREGAVLQWDPVELLSRLAGRAVRLTAVQDQFRALALAVVAARG